MRNLIVFVLLLSAVALASADVFRVVNGPSPYRVYQRTPANTADIDISVELTDNAGDAVQARILKSGKTVEGFEWRQLDMGGGCFSGELKGVPVGGPYTIELKAIKNGKVAASRFIQGILVGDLWILAGQSNMEGCGRLINVEEPSPYVNALYYGDYWAVAKDPLCWFDEAVEPVHWSSKDPKVRKANAKQDRLFREHGAGLAVRFGKEMYNATGVPVGLIVCPHGGTSMAQWSPGLKGKGGESLYGCLIRRINLAGGRVTGCLWYQGEAEAIDFDGKDYLELTKNFIESLRSDLGQSDMPFIYVQLGPYRIWGLPKSPRAGWNKVQNDQLLLEKELKNIAFAAAVDATLSDPIHLDAVSLSRLGVRLSKLARKMVFNHSFETGPRPAKIEFVGKGRRKIRVVFDGVNGSLAPKRDIRGFLVEKDDKATAITSCVTEKNGKSVILTLYEPAPEKANIWYGRGLYPTVNLADKEDFPAPVFGPVKLPD